jgi:tRNA-uridine 2-sulfurtransferase
MKKNVKAIALFSGGLDSILAIKVLQEQGIEVVGVHFALPFCGDGKGSDIVKNIANSLNLKFRIESMGMDYLEVVKYPKHGHGTGMNPCIDCKIYMLIQAKKIMEEEGAEFIATGEVLNQRPMSQHRIALNAIEKDSGLKGKLLRPLSAKFLTETNVEKYGIIDRSKLPSIIGRSRKEQLSLAKEKSIDFFIPAAGGCLLTDKYFVKKLKDLLEHKNDADWEDIRILNIGRHFRHNESKIIVGRHEKENEALVSMKKPADYLLELPEEIPGPVTILQGDKSGKAIELAAALTLRYSDLKEHTALVNCTDNLSGRQIYVDISILSDIDYFNISSGNKD